MLTDRLRRMPNFEPFRRATPRAEGPTATLTERGVLTLSREAVELIGSPEHVRLLWDRDARVLGVQAASTDHPDALRLSITRGMGARNIAAKDFARWADIDLTPTRRWPAHLDGEVLCVDLSTPGTKVTSNRARR